MPAIRYLTRSDQRLVVRASFLTAALSVALAACGSSHPKTTAHHTAAGAGAAVAVSRVPAPQLKFLAPGEAATVGSPVVARVQVTGRGQVEFILDRRRPAPADGGPAPATEGTRTATITFHNVAPGPHVLVAELVKGEGGAPLASATAHFRVRGPVPVSHPAAAAPATAAVTGGAGATTSTPMPTPAAPPAPSPAPAAPPQPAPTRAPAPSQAGSAPPSPPVVTPMPAPAAHPQAGSGIPQGGGGDGDADNNGAPSDGDGPI